MIADALKWCVRAFAAGEVGADQLIDRLVARLDPARPAATSTSAQAVMGIQLRIVEACKNPAH